MINLYISTRSLFCKLLILGLISGCASTSTPLSNNNNDDDPWESWNRVIHTFNNDVGKKVVGPVHQKYSSIMPGWFMAGTANFFSNLKDIGVTINDLMQLKFEQSAMDGSRFMINTTVGVVGLVDVASMIDFNKHNESFGQTLGFWGVPSGNYLVMPFLGPSSPSEVVGILGDALLNPLTYTFVFSASGAVLSSINSGAQVFANSPNSNLSVSENEVSEVAVDNYRLNKDISNYLSSRKNIAVVDGQAPDQVFSHVFISP